MDLDPVDAYLDQADQFLRVGMVMSVDGSATDEQSWTDALGGAADLRVFRALRALADGILVGADTIRTGRVGPHRPAGALRERRAVLGRPRPAPIVVVSRSLRLDWSHRLFTEAESPTLIATCSAAPVKDIPQALRHQVLVIGADHVDLPELVRTLRTERGMRHLLCEGGPRLAAGLINLRLVDELCLSIAPTLLGARPHTRLLGELDQRIELSLSNVYFDEGVVFLRYRLR